MNTQDYLRGVQKGRRDGILAAREKVTDMLVLNQRLLVKSPTQRTTDEHHACIAILEEVHHLIDGIEL